MDDEEMQGEDSEEYTVGPGHPPKEHRFKPGQSGNPAGAPKGSVRLRPLLLQKLAEVPPGDRRSYAELLIQRTIADAISRDGPSRKMVWEVLEGRPRQALEITARGEFATVDDDVREKLREKIAAIAERMKPTQDLPERPELPESSGPLA